MSKYTDLLGQAYAAGFADGYNNVESHAIEYNSMDMEDETERGGFCRAYNHGYKDGQIDLDASNRDMG